MWPHEPGLFTSSIVAIVMPRKTSSAASRCAGGAGARADKLGGGASGAGPGAVGIVSDGAAYAGTASGSEIAVSWICSAWTCDMLGRSVRWDAQQDTPARDESL